MNTDTPETDAQHLQFAMGGFTLDFCRKLEREREKWKALATQYSVEREHNAMKALAYEAERDEWKAKYIQQNKDIGSKMSDTPTPETDKFFATFADGQYAPSHAEYYVRLQDLERERDEAREQRDTLIEQQQQWRLSSVCRELTEQRDRLTKALQNVIDEDGTSRSIVLANEILQSLATKQQ